MGCYVHIPFCVKKCAYCDFNSYGGYKDDAVRRYVRALEREVRSQTKRETSVDSVFFGGGTPTAIPANDEAALLQAVRESLPVTNDAEITTEANPGTADIAGLDVLRRAGFNRISFGVQSFDAGLLKTLDRIHSAGEAREAVKAARAAGFGNVSVDLMFGLPRQTMAQWHDTLNAALELGTDHISLYSLIVEEGTGFATLAGKGRLPLPEDDLVAEMYQLAIDTAAGAGLAQYEISNFARPGYECRHNIHYWRNDPYYGFGAGAVGYLDDVRRTNRKLPAEYAGAVERGEDLVLEAEELTPSQQMAETIMLGLRLTREGVDCRRFARRFGVDPREVYSCQVERFTKLGLLEAAGDTLRLTPRGVFLGNEVMQEFV